MSRPQPPWRNVPTRILSLSLTSALALIGGLFVGTQQSCRVPDGEFCNTSAECRQRNGGLAARCHPTAHVCISPGAGQCEDSKDCSTDPQRPACDQTTFECMPCKPQEGKSNDCEHLQNPIRPYCVSTDKGATCVECRSHLDCPSDRPICDGNLCRTCAEHGECGPKVTCSDGQQCTGSWVCIGKDDIPNDDLAKLAGRCAANGNQTGKRTEAGLVVYAVSPQANPMLCDDVKNAGTLPTTPKCTIDAAVLTARQEGRPYIRLVATGGPFAPAAAIDGTVDKAKLVVVGAPLPSVGGATVTGMVSPLFEVRNGALLTLDQVEIQQDQAAGTAITCTDATLRVIRSQVLGATKMPVGGPGVLLRDCGNSVLDRNLIGARKAGDPAHAYGVQISTTKMTRPSYILSGNIVAGNTIAGLDLSNVGNADINANFNTITQNGQGAGRGVVCPLGGGATILLANSIIAGNPVVDTALDQFTNRNNCAYERVVIGKNAPVMGNMNLLALDPALTATFHLAEAKTPQMSASSACCIDVVPASDRHPVRDIDNQKRPVGDKWDIGADEWSPTP